MRGRGCKVPFGAEVDDAEDGEAGKGQDVAEGMGEGEGGEGAAGWGQVVCVEEEEEEGEPVADGSGQGCAEHAEVELVDEDVVEECVEGARDQQNVRAASHDFCQGKTRCTLK